MEITTATVADAPRPRKPRAAARAVAKPVVDDERPVLPPRRKQNPWIRRILIFATLVLMLDALFGERGLSESMRARQQYEAASSGLSGLKQENAGLREQIRRLQEDPAAIESVARRELGLIRPGEILVVVRDAK